MKYISKAQRQLDGDLLLRQDTQALLFRTLQELEQHLAARQDAPDDCIRAISALKSALGDVQGRVPPLNDLLGDPVRERVARNLLKI